jgi:hypothetical protein
MGYSAFHPGQPTVPTRITPLCRLLASLALLSSVAACAPAPSTLPAELKAEMGVGMSIDEVGARLRAHGTTLSVHSATECQALLDRSPNIAQLPPRGGPCLFGKIPLSKTWYGGHTDVILQIVFDASSKLVDANFEELGSFL